MDLPTFQDGISIFLNMIYPLKVWQSSNIVNSNAKIREFQLSFGPESFVFLSAKPLKIKIYNTKMLPVLLYRIKLCPSIKLRTWAEGV